MAHAECKCSEHRRKITSHCSVIFWLGFAVLHSLPSKSLGQLKVDIYLHHRILIKFNEEKGYVINELKKVIVDQQFA